MNYTIDTVTNHFIYIFVISELYYGYYFAFMGISFFAENLLSEYFIGEIGIYKTVFLGFCISLLGGMIMTVWYLYTGDDSQFHLAHAY